MSGSFGSWHLDSLVAVGGLGEVWRARRDDTVAALKRLHTHLARNEDATAQFAVEQRLATTLPRHPNVVHGLETGDVDVISAFSSDGRIAAYDLELLGDPKRAIPAYDAVMLVAPRRTNDPLILRALEPLIGKITPQRMQEANFMVDRDTDKVSPQEAARFLARSIGVPAR